MKFEIKEVYNKEVWEGFLSGCQEKTFLSSWNWGEFQKAMGGEIWRFGIFENNNLLSAALVIKIKARRGTFLFVPHGPVVKEQKAENQEQIVELFLNKFRKIAAEEKASFIRIAPIWERNEVNIKTFRDLGFRDAPIHIHPELTRELDIQPLEEELLSNMRKTTRYLIRQAQKNLDIKIENSNDISAIIEFNKLYQETTDRHHFIPFSLDYLKNQFQAFSGDNKITIFLGKYKDEIVSAAIIVFWQNLAFYHHGASSLKYPKIPVSYLLQWEAIKEAKRRGCKLYNFWGIVPENKKNHPWTGLTLFKTGFGGYKKEYVKTQDLPLSKGYWLTFIFEKMRKIKRGL